MRMYFTIQPVQKLPCLHLLVLTLPNKSNIPLCIRMLIVKAR